MFIFTTKLTKKKLIGAIVISGVLLVAIIALLATNSSDEASTQTNATVKNIKTNDDRVAYLSGLGWDVSSEPEETQEVLIPSEWDEIFTAYNEMQKLTGFDLDKLKNKKVMRYTYKLNNYPSDNGDVYATVLVYKKMIVGGDIQSRRLDGFMTGLEKKA